VNICLPNKRYLTPHLLADGRDNGLSVVTIGEDGSVNYTPFAEERHSTLWIDGPIILIKNVELNDFLLSDIEMMISMQRGIPAINDYLKSSSLYPLKGESCTAIILQHVTS